MWVTQPGSLLLVSRKPQGKCPPALRLHRKTPRGQDLLSQAHLTGLLTRFLTSCGPGATLGSLPCGPLQQGISSHGNLLYQSQQGRVSASKQKFSSHVTWWWKWYPIALLYSVHYNRVGRPTHAQNSRRSPTPWILVGGDHRDHLQVCLPRSVLSKKA